MGVADKYAEQIQDLLDSGYNPTKTGAVLGLDHRQVLRVVDKYKLEFYTPFDEGVEHLQLEPDEWLLEDLLEMMCNTAYDDYYVEITTFFNEDIYGVGKHVSQVYGTIFNYLKIKKKSVLGEFIYLKCANCYENKNIKRYPQRLGRHFGLTKEECKDCRNKRVGRYYMNNPEYRKTMVSSGKKWALKNKDKIKKYAKLASHKRMARKKSLPNDLSSNELKVTMKEFNGKCAISDSDDIHFDHVIPLSIGHGGTTYGNMIPLRSDLNLSKNNSNIFEWFEANRQRFDLPQERFDNLIAWLASANTTTVEEYRKHVYWCHANPRSIDELKDASSKEVI